MTRFPGWTLLAAAALAVAGYVAAPYAAPLLAPSEPLPAWVLERAPDRYAPQRVVYHLKEGGGLLHRRFKGVLNTLENHVAALGAGQLDLRVVMQGDGVDLLLWARGDAAARRAIDALKAKGVRFEICRNTLVQRRLNPDTRLHGVAREDVVSTAVGQIGALTQRGYSYIRL